MLILIKNLNNLYNRTNFFNQKFNHIFSRKYSSILPPNRHFYHRHLKWRKGSNYTIHFAGSTRLHLRQKSNGKKEDKLSSLVQPVPVKRYNDLDGIRVGEELAGIFSKEDLMKLINKFNSRPEIKRLSQEVGLDNNLFHKAFVDFRKFCIESEQLPADLHITVSDILQEAGHIDDLFPYFLRHAKTMYPHLDCMDDLRKISDLREPANWYPEARSIQRKVIYHAGPTNSGKTYQALERFFSAKSGIYCGPLRLLASEVFNKSNDFGTNCDLITGEERRYVDPFGKAANHVALTVEMTNISQQYEVAVIDEIQMIRDMQRGWAWTRAFLGIPAQEVHVCGEEAGIELIRELSLVTGDEFEVRRYKRLTSLKVMDKAIENFSNIKTGDCIVCFNKNDIYNVSKQLELRGIEVAVIYGTLPPGTKISQAEKFNDPSNECNVMVATDAIGMGLNLSIRRIVFYSLVKPTINDRGEKEMDLISPSTALQIAGRAGRFSSRFVGEGQVMAFKTDDLPVLQRLLATPVETIQQAGLHPTAEQIELFAFHLPKATLSNLIDIFVMISQMDNDKFFMCNIDDFKFLADMIQHVPLQLRVQYVFCCAPIPKKQAFVCAMFLKFARQYSRGQALTLEWLCRHIGWPFKTPQTITDLVHLEGVFDILDLYLWLSYRFTDMFPDVDHVRDMQTELDYVIRAGVASIVRLLKNSETAILSGFSDIEDDFEMANKAARRKPQNSIDPAATTINNTNLYSSKSIVNSNNKPQNSIDPVSTVNKTNLYSSKSIADTNNNVPSNTIIKSIPSNTIIKSIVDRNNNVQSTTFIKSIENTLVDNADSTSVKNNSASNNLSAKNSGYSKNRSHFLANKNNPGITDNINNKNNINNINNDNNNNNNSHNINCSILSEDKNRIKDNSKKATLSLAERFQAARESGNADFRADLKVNRSKVRGGGLNKWTSSDFRVEPGVSISDELVRRGLISRETLRKLQRELLEERLSCDKNGGENLFEEDVDGCDVVDIEGDNKIK